MAIGGPIRLSEIKYAIYGGLRFHRNLYAGWAFEPSIGMVARDVNKLGLDLENFKVPLTKAIRLIMMPSIKKNFVMEGRPVEWEPLALYTEQQRGSARPILYRTGNLERAASSFGIWTITDTSATIKSLPSDVWYGAIQQEGYGSLGQIARKQLGAGASAAEIQERAISLFMGDTPGPRQTKFVIPARPFILFQDEDIETIQEVFIDWMEDQADQVGRSWNVIR